MITLRFLTRNCAFVKATRNFSISSKCLNNFTEVTDNDGVRNIVLANDKTRNSLSLEMMDTLIENITHNQTDKTLRVIVLSAKGSVFSAGHNLKELTEAKGSNFHQQVFSRCTDLINSIIQSPVPVVAKVDGLAAAAGCQLVASCDMAVCSDRSQFSTPGASFGIFCSTPGIAVVRAVPRMKAAYMLFTGLPIKADEALQAGLVSRVVTAEQLDGEIKAICEAIKTKSRSVVELGKRFFHEQIALDLKSAYKRGERVMVENLGMRDGVEGIQSFVEKRKPKWSHSD